MIAPDGTAYEVTGPVDAPVVALIHGLGLCRRVWDGVLPDLAAFRVVNYDLYGHGKSARPPLPAVSLRVFADQLAGLLAHAGVARAHVVGFSIGGMINRRFALDYPDRVASLVILNSPHDRGDGQDAVEARAKTVREQGAMSTMDAALERWFTPAHQSGKLADQVVGWRRQVDPDGYSGAAWVLAHGVRELISPDPPISAPTLVMTCENDSGSTPEMSEAISAEIAGARLNVIPRLKHLGLMEAPDLFARPIQDFLKAHVR